MKPIYISILAALVASAALAAPAKTPAKAPAKAANPFDYKNCAKRFGTLEKKHQRMHETAVHDDETEQFLARNDPKRLQGARGRIKAELARKHAKLEAQAKAKK